VLPRIPTDRLSLHRPRPQPQTQGPIRLDRRRKQGDRYFRGGGSAHGAARTTELDVQHSDILRDLVPIRGF